MKFLLFFTLVCIAICEDTEEEIHVEENVLVVTEANWDKAVTSSNNVLVEFYAPWCGHCKKLAPEYATAATRLKKDKADVALAKVDATIETGLSKKYGVRGFPTIKFFKNGIAMDYTGGRKSEDIVVWLNKKTGPPAKVLENEDDVKNFAFEKEVAVVGFFKSNESDLAEEFIKAAEDMDDIEFGISTLESSGDLNIKEDKIVLFKQFDDLRVAYTGEVHADAITKFVRLESLPLVTEFTDATANKIYRGSIKSNAILFISKEAENFAVTLNTLTAVAGSYKGQVRFVLVDVDVITRGSKRLLKEFSLEPEDCPAIRIAEFQGNRNKYVPETDELDETSITSFVQDVVDGKVKPYFKSEEVAEDWDKESVKVMVGKNFKEVILEGGKDAFVEFYAPWCGHCKKLAPTWEKLGDHYKNNDDIIIAKMDSTLNEVEEVKITGFPTLKYFKKGKLIDYKGGRDFEDFVKFIEKQGIKVAKDAAPTEAESNQGKDEL